MKKKQAAKPEPVAVVEAPKPAEVRVLRGDEIKVLRIGRGAVGNPDGLTQNEEDLAARALHEVLMAMPKPERTAALPDEDFAHARRHLAVHRTDGGYWMVWRRKDAYAVPLTVDGVRYLVSPAFQPKIDRAAQKEKAKRENAYIALTIPERAMVDTLAEAPADLRSLYERVIREFLMNQARCDEQLTPRTIADRSPRVVCSPETMAILDPSTSPPAEIVNRALQRDQAIFDARWYQLQEREEAERVKRDRAQQDAKWQNAHRSSDHGSRWGSTAGKRWG
jgi:hypothetical protein